MPRLSLLHRFCYKCVETSAAPETGGFDLQECSVFRN
jgi:hypothetical protein